MFKYITKYNIKSAQVTARTGFVNIVNVVKSLKINREQ